ncbi:hypothetical protein MTR67_007989 [Solanum verrucosum]|uniref:Uncharacterized protein n=1 Tax=Solanum verrucosum TaxID=315347 RepID=A0AAF0TDJ6_SOLVR|nr:hypothetical protein MTR67_007989 [Solanum verrucosum]
MSSPVLLSLSNLSYFGLVILSLCSSLNHDPRVLTFGLVEVLGTEKVSYLNFNNQSSLKRKNAGKSNKFHRAIVGGGGTWKRSDISKPIYEKKRSVIGFKNSILNGNMKSNVTQLPAAIQEECSVPVLHQETLSVSLLAKESNVPAAKEVEECSVPVETRPDYDIATYHKELDAYAASILETMVPYVPEPQEDDDEIPLFSEDFYIGHTNLWSSVICDG